MENDSFRQILNALPRVDSRRIYTVALIVLMLATLLGCGKAAPVESNEIGTPTPGPVTYDIEDWLTKLCNETPGLDQAEQVFLLNPGDRAVLPDGLKYEQTKDSSLQTVSKPQHPLQKREQGFTGVGAVDFLIQRIPGDMSHSALDAKMTCPSSILTEAPAAFQKGTRFSLN